MHLYPQEVSYYTVDLVEENAAGVVGMELDCGLVNKTTKEHVPAECSQAPTVEGGAHISDWDLRLGTRWCKVMYHGTLEVVRRTFPSTETAYTLQAVMIPLGTEGFNYITLTEEEESARS
ncbi:hypothetical protein EMCRGX_G027752 [Ephydatia muelleri]